MRLFENLIKVIPWRDKTLHSSLLTLISALAVGSSLAETVELRSEADWNKFAERVNNGEGSLNAIMANDFAIGNNAILVGASQNYPFTGEFDGNGKTLTLNLITKKTSDSADEPLAPFSYIFAANIHDLRTVGTVTSTKKYASSLVGVVLPKNSLGDSYLTRCHSSVTVQSLVSGDGSSSGMIAKLATNIGGYVWGRIICTDCLFDGSLAGPNTDCWGGFCGIRGTACEIWLRNCLFAPQSVSVKDSNNYTLSRGGFWSDNNDLKNTYYTTAMGSAQGTDASGETAESLAQKLGANWTVTNGKTVPILVVSEEEFTSAAAAFTYQGVLRDAQGAILSQKNHTITFRIYDQATDGAVCWAKKVDVLLDEDGLFNAEISDDKGEAIEGVPGEGLSHVLAQNSGSSLYIGLTVDDSQSEIAPRQKLFASPYATFAADAAAASGSVAVTGKLESEHLVAKGYASAKTITITGDVSASQLTYSGVLTGDGTIPLGGIITWSGSVGNIPDGWALCNGQTSNGRQTPDLRGMFIPGAGSGYAVGDKGGAESVTLTESQMAKHRHLLYGRSSGYVLAHNNSHEVITYSEKNWGSWTEKINDSNYTGENGAHENRPPYYALCFIMRVK